jgi:hypothetical protein
MLEDPIVHRIIKHYRNMQKLLEMPGPKWGRLTPMERTI